MLKNQIKRARAANTINFQKLFRQVQMVYPAPIELKCYVCGLVMVEPVQWSCGHRSCHNCYDGREYCDEDNDWIEDVYSDSRALIEIMMLTCFCVKKNQGCAWQGEAYSLEQHLKEDCEFNTTCECPYKDLKCAVNGTKKTMLEHADSSIVHHNMLLAVHVKQEERASLNFVSRLADMNDWLKKIERFIGGFDTHIGFCRFYERFEEYTRRARELLVAADEMKNVSIPSKDDVNKLYDSILFLLSHIKGEDENAVNECVDKVRKINGEINRQKSTKDNINFRILLYEGTTYNACYVWRIDRVASKIVEGISDNNTAILTPTLQTSQEGYKYLLKAKMCDRHKKNDEKCMGIYFQLLKGDFNANLHYPFSYDVSITLINMSGKKDLEVVLKSNDDEPAFQRPITEINRAIGYKKFCSHQRLYSGGFVKDDTMFIRSRVLLS